MVRHRLDHGDAFYAPNLLRTDGGRTVLWAWLRECRLGELDRASSWSGCLTLPREVRLDEEGRLVMEPTAEVKLLRTATHRWRSGAGDPATWLSAHEGSCLEIELAWARTAKGHRGIAVSVAEDGSEETRVVHDPERGVLLVERSNSRAEGNSLTHSETLCAPFPLSPESPTRLRVFLDRSVLEVFTGTAACISTRIYPACHGRRGLRLIGETEDLRALSVHEMG
jgi:beta-fructofuranosidase